MGWIGVDFDGTLARYEGWQEGQLGAPVPAMVKRVRRWLSEGREVRVVTARVAESGRTNADGQVDSTEFCALQRVAIEAWCEEHLGRALEVTASKDFEMEALYDDRAVPVETNTGRLLKQRWFTLGEVLEAAGDAWEEDDD